VGDRLRVVFDTSTLIGAMLRPNSVPRRALLTAVDRHEICVSVATLDELRTVLQRPKFDRYQGLPQRQGFLELLIQYSHIVEVDAHSVQISQGACRDPKDEQFLALALSSHAVALVSSDNDLLTMHPWNNVAIITPAAFLLL
jgi:uncharacterized protein